MKRNLNPVLNAMQFFETSDMVIAGVYLCLGAL